LNLLGLGGHDADADVSAGPGFGTETALDHPELDAHSTGLALISVRTVVAFFVGFGWTGAVLLASGAPVWMATLLALAVGVGFLLVVFYLMRAIFRLSDSGNIDYRNAAGQTGTVYVTVPAKGQGTGQIQIILQGRLRELPAITDSEIKLAPGTPIHVTRVIGSTMLVEKMEAK
jgi:membrane protein implicated in regulation of membrane protease activity